MKFKPGDKVYIEGTIQRVEILPGDVAVYYCREHRETAFREEDLMCAKDAYITVEGVDALADEFKQFAEAIEKARSLYEELANFDMKLNLSFNNKGKTATTELAHVFTDMSND